MCRSCRSFSERHHHSSMDGLPRRSLLRSGEQELVRPRFLAACLGCVLRWLLSSYSATRMGVMRYCIWQVVALLYVRSLFCASRPRTWSHHDELHISKYITTSNLCVPLFEGCGCVYRGMLGKIITRLSNQVIPTPVPIVSK